MYQEHIRFSARKADGILQVTKEEESFGAVECTRNAPARTRGQSYGDAEISARTQYKVPVIMDYAIFRKQVYRRTGGQRDSMRVVTDSIQREIDPTGFLRNQTQI
jgi:hypothetical protein